MIVLERLQKYLAQAGIASRRQAEELIKNGRVKVNGQTVTEMGLKINPASDVVTFDDFETSLQEEKIYLILNKPARVVTTLLDPQGRCKVTDLIKGVKARVFPVGRLDYLTEGLLLLTNDGELAYRLTHPKYKVDKTYVAEVRGAVAEPALRKLQQGVMLADGLTAPAQVRCLGVRKGTSTLEITISEGRNRQVRRMCAVVGHPVLALKRVRFGPLNLEGLEAGQYRHLHDVELEALKKACDMLAD